MVLSFLSYRYGRVGMKEDTECEDSSTENVEEFLLKERKRTDMLVRQNSIPKTLPNHRASLIISSRPVSGNNSPSHSPRKRTVSETAASRTTTPTSTSTANVRNNDFLATRGKSPSFEVKRPVGQQQDEEEEELALLEFKKEFIKGSLKAKTYEQRTMVAGDVTFFEDALGSDFCVTAKSSPYSTPPPERMMSSDVSKKEIALLKIELKKMRDQLTSMSQQQAKINLSFIEMEKEKKNTATASTCSLF